MLLSLLLPLVAAGPPEELITSLPNLVEPMRSKQYSGYLNISDTKALYYWYVESENDPSLDPLVLWLNGGPGCSSLEGLMVEMGPFRTHDFGATLERNPWTWNRYASIIYLDAPAGVGFSIRTDNETDWIYSDDEVANDNWNAIALWFTKFPERKGNDFYVMGESYGGTYVPMLSALLADDTRFPNFKGIAIGNGCVDDVKNVNSGVQYNYNHAFIDEEYYQNALQKCCSDKKFTETCDFYTMANDKNNKCYEEATYLSQANYYTGLDPYFLYYSCYLNAGDKPQFSMVEDPVLGFMDDEEVEINAMNNGANDYQGTILRQQMRLRYANRADAAPQTLPSCTHYNDSTVYLQRNDLRKALHIPDSVPQYESCNYFIAQYYDFGPSHHLNQADNILKLVNMKKRVMLFNGDTDSICNAIHNSQFVKALNLQKISNETTWQDNSQMPPTIGMITRYDGVDFLTVRGAGHFVSSSNEKPKEALQMFYNYIHNLDYSSPITADVPYNGGTKATQPVNPDQGSTTVAPENSSNSTTTTTPTPTTTSASAVAIMTSLASVILSFM